MTAKIGDKKVVSMDYTLRNGAGEVLDTSDGQGAFSYLHGGEEIVPGLEKQLTGMSTGESKDVIVPPEEGYGTHDPQGIFSVPRTAFPENAVLTVGETFVGEDDQGNELPVRIVSVTTEEVTVDANHPLAGETLHFHVDIRGVRDATDEELSHGHVHGPEGHGHQHD